MLGHRAPDSPVGLLTPREREVLGAMAEGKSNQGIATSLFVTEAAVEKHVTSIFQKLKLGPTSMEHRRVLAVLAFLRDAQN
jgi:DNA-binding NarL/FixJ family response regulator